MKTKLCVQVLGSPDILLNGRSLSAKLPQKAHALFYYLAVTNHPQSREKLATFFWGNKSDARARNNLSIVLNKLKQAGLGPYLKTDRYTVAVQQDEGFVLDVMAFEHTANHREQFTLKEQQAQAERYRGEFLAEFYVGQEEDIWPFVEWVHAQRARLQTVALKFFALLTEDLIQKRAFEDALPVVERQLGMLPWHEEGHRQKMRILALQGKREQAIAQYQQCCEILDTELAIEPNPTTITLYENILADDLTFLVQPSQQTPFQAPALPAHFVGRAALLKAVTQQLKMKSQTPLALVGMGGIGKSTMAAQVAQQCRHLFTDGVLWAHADVDDLMSILEHWGQAFGMDWSQIGELENRAAAFRNLMAEKKVLIVLDDLRAVDKVRLLVPNSSKCRILLTTRDQDVAYGLDATLIGLDGFANEESLALIETIVGGARVDREAAHVQQICDLLEHLPLAVEIVAQRLRSRPRWPIRKLASELTAVKSRLDKLQLKDRAVRASFELSWQMLDTTLQRCFAQLAVFAGRSFSKEAADAIINSKDDVEEHLETLIALSLLSANEANYYRQHALLADFAMEKLVKPQNAYCLMIDYYTDFVQEYRQDYEKLKPEWNNLMATIEAAYRQEMWQHVLDFSEILTPAWKAQGHYTLARQAYNFSHNATIKLGDNLQLSDNFLRWGEACIEQNDYAIAKNKIEQSLKHYRKLQIQDGVARSQYHLARIAIEQDEYDEASRLLEASQATWEKLNNRLALGGVFYRQATISYNLGEMVDAKNKLEMTLNIQEEVNDQQGMIPTLRLLAQIPLENQSAPKILKYSQKAYQISKDLQDEGELATTLFTQTIVHRRLGNLDKASWCAQEGIDILRRIGLLRVEAFLLFEVSIIHEIRKEFTEAVTTAYDSIKILTTINDTLSCNLLKMHLGDIYQQLQQFDMAKNYWNEVLSYATSANHVNLLADVKGKIKDLEKINF